MANRSSFTSTSPGLDCICWVRCLLENKQGSQVHTAPSTHCMHNCTYVYTQYSTYCTMYVCSECIHSTVHIAPCTYVLNVYTVQYIYVFTYMHAVHIIRTYVHTYVYIHCGVRTLAHIFHSYISYIHDV